MKKFLRNLALVCATLFAYQTANSQTVAVTADLKTMFGGAAATKTQVCLSLVDGNGNQLSNPRTSGGVIVPTATQCVLPDGSGHVATNAIANDQITPSGSVYSITYLYNGRSVHGDTYQFLLADGTENLNTKTGIAVAPVVPTPTGDSTYLRLDGGNTPTAGINFGLFTDIFGVSQHTETNAPICVSGYDFLWGDSTVHRLKECDNGGASSQLVHSGADINTSDQVTVTHLAAPLPTNQGGTGVSTAQGTGPKNQLAAGTTTTNDFISYDSSGNAVDSGKVAPSGAVVGTTDSQILTTKTFDTASNTFKVNGITVNEATGLIFQQCIGTFGASTTNVLVNGSACNNGTGNQFPVTAGTFKNLLCHSNTGGVNASSGIVTVRKNAVNTTLTCTFGTGVTCGGGDTTHSFTTTNSDLLDILVQTQAAETLATMSCTVEKY